jgi:flagellar biosynthesis protein FlhF
MQTKTYFASSVPAALELARKELGEEALLVNSRPTPPAARSYGRLEVTFAWDPKPAPRTLPSAPARTLPPPQPQKPASELDEIREQISALRMAVTRPSLARISEPEDYLAGRLTDGGFNPECAREISIAAARRPGDSGAALIQELTARIPAAPYAEMQPGESRTLAFIGPPGRGKTTTLIKIAVRCGVARRIPVKIYGAGCHGVCGEEQLARFATILGVPFQAFESLESLHLALNGDKWKGLILIDTPGISPAETTETSEFTRFFARRPEIEKHLVLRADTRSADMFHVISRFSDWGVSRLLFTGLDETLSVGAVVETLVRSQVPAVFAGTGQQMPDDLEVIDPAGLARAVCGEHVFAENMRAAMAA